MLPSDLSQIHVNSDVSLIPGQMWHAPALSAQMPVRHRARAPASQMQVTPLGCTPFLWLFSFFLSHTATFSVKPWNCELKVARSLELMSSLKNAQDKT